MPRSFFISLNYELREICLGISIWIYISHTATGGSERSERVYIRRPPTEVGAPATGRVLSFLPKVHSYGGDAPVIFIALNSDTPRDLSWCYDIMVLWCYDIMVLWYYGIMILWYYGISIWIYISLA